MVAADMLGGRTCGGRASFAGACDCGRSRAAGYLDYTDDIMAQDVTCVVVASVAAHISMVYVISPALYPLLSHQGMAQAR